MRLIHASAFALFLLTVAPVGSFAADAKSDVTAAYAAWDAAFNKGDAKAVAAAYLPNAKLLPPTHEVASGPAAIEKFFAGLHANGVTNHKLEVIDAGGKLERQRQGQGRQACGLLWHRHACVRTPSGQLVEA
jgi:hypothetical protein